MLVRIEKGEPNVLVASVEKVRALEAGGVVFIADTPPACQRPGTERLLDRTLLSMRISLSG